MSEYSDKFLSFIAGIVVIIIFKMFYEQSCIITSV